MQMVKPREVEENIENRGYPWSNWEGGRLNCSNPVQWAVFLSRSVPDFRGIAFSVLPLSMMFALDFSYMAFIVAIYEIILKCMKLYMHLYYI